MIPEEAGAACSAPKGRRKAKSPTTCSDSDTKSDDEPEDSAIEEEFVYAAAGDDEDEEAASGVAIDSNAHALATLPTFTLFRGRLRSPNYCALEQRPRNRRSRRRQDW
jgi:hypothetical protein